MVVNLLELFGPTVGILVLGTVDLVFGDSYFEQNRSWDDLDDHFRDLGHQPKFYRVQDAGFINGSSIR